MNIFVELNDMKQRIYSSFERQIQIVSTLLLLLGKRMKHCCRRDDDQ